jgi:hypothetical protein
VSELNRSATAPTTAGQREYLDAMISRVSGAFPGGMRAILQPDQPDCISTAGTSTHPFWGTDVIVARAFRVAACEQPVGPLPRHDQCYEGSTFRNAHHAKSVSRIHNPCIG